MMQPLMARVSGHLLFILGTAFAQPETPPAFEVASVKPANAGMNISMPQLAKRLSGYLRRPVLDRTGLAGSFDFKFVYESHPADDSRPDLISSIFASIQGIGLKLESAKGPVETVGIDT
jgi:Protein of unknown function (DUF3738)